MESKPRLILTEILDWEVKESLRVVSHGATTLSSSRNQKWSEVGSAFLVQSHRYKKAAKKFFRKLLRTLRYVPRALITDKLRSCSSAKAEVLTSVEHRQQKYHNNRAENSHQPTRLREKVMRGFKSARHAQRFLSAFGIITSHFRVGRHLYKASADRAVMNSKFALWDEAKAIVN